MQTEEIIMKLRQALDLIMFTKVLDFKPGLLKTALELAEEIKTEIGLVATSTEAIMGLPQGLEDISGKEDSL